MYSSLKLLCALVLCVASNVAWSQAPANSQSLLVLNTGRVLSGRISESAGGYVVDNPDGHKGSMRVPFTIVRFEAQNLREAYLKLRKFMPEVTANNRIQLARWCITQGLTDEAKLELRDALRLEPQRSETRKLLLRLDRSGATSASLMLTLPKSESTTPTFDQTETRSLSGFSRPLAEQFVARVQPLMINKCSNSGCHSQTSDQEFRLKRIRAGRGHRLYSQQNLAVVLQRIDMEHPTQSKLLVALSDGHARTGSDLLEGRAGVQQAETIREWVFDVVAERTGKDPRRTMLANQQRATSTSTFPGLQAGQQFDPSQILANANSSSEAFAEPNANVTATNLGHSLPSTAEIGTSPASPSAPPIPHGLIGHPRDPSNAGLLQTPPTPSRKLFPFMPALPDSAANQIDSDDPFDPEEFNRLYGNQTPQRQPPIQQADRQAQARSFAP